MKHSDMERQNQLTYCKILKTNINVTDMEHTISYITRNLDSLKGDYICVSNVHTTVMAYRDKEYRGCRTVLPWRCRTASLSPS